VTRHEFLGRVHALVQPRTYLEIGVRDGASLALSRATSVAIDPAFRITHELRCDMQLVRATSDDFFARPDPLGHFKGKPIDLAFIDGMHLFEYALRDFINVEQHTRASSIVVFDDVLPRDVDEAARDRHTVLWAGDVYKLIPVLHRHRPDLLVLPLDTHPTGLLLILSPDPRSTVLRDEYDAITAAYVVEDPQSVPQEILDRRCALDPEAVLEAPLWSSLARGTSGSATHLSHTHAWARELFGVDAPAWLGKWQPPPVSDRATETASGHVITAVPHHRLHRWRARVASYVPAAWRRAIRP